MTAHRPIDINCDLGESFGAFTVGNDAAVLPMVTSANIGCGFHGGDPIVMHGAMKGILAAGGNIGAHPSLYDIWGFGRRPIAGDTPEDIRKTVIYQIGAAHGMAGSLGAKLAHVKLHGSLDSLASADDAIAEAVTAAMTAFTPTPFLIAQPSTALERQGRAAGLAVCTEIYADRAYADDGTLVSRKHPGALLSDPVEVVERVLAMLETGTVQSIGGRTVEIGCPSSICVHGDTPEALEMLTALRVGLVDAGWRIAPHDPAAAV